MGGLYVAPTGHMAQWEWDDPAAHINVKELAAIFHGLSHLQLSDASIQVHTDSTVCHRVLTRQYTRSRRLQPLLGSILDLCAQSNLHLQVHWVATDVNPADWPSRAPLTPGPLQVRAVYPCGFQAPQFW